MRSGPEGILIMRQLRLYEDPSIGLLRSFFFFYIIFFFSANCRNASHDKSRSGTAGWEKHGYNGICARFTLCDWKTTTTGCSKKKKKRSSPPPIHIFLFYHFSVGLDSRLKVEEWQFAY